MSDFRESIWYTYARAKLSFPWLDDYQLTFMAALANPYVNPRHSVATAAKLLRIPRKKAKLNLAHLKRGLDR